MRIQHNILAMNAYRNYGNNTSALGKNLEKLSSGYKINRAGDDAAGLAISEKMRAQIQGLSAASKNVKDAISFVKTAEGAMQEIQDMLSRMKYLATQSANGTYENSVDRKALQDEVNSLLEEINRIAKSANFNDIHMLNGPGGDADVEITASVTEPNDAGLGEVTVEFGADATAEQQQALAKALESTTVSVKATCSTGASTAAAPDGLEITGLPPAGYTAKYLDADGKETDWPQDNKFTIGSATGNVSGSVTINLYGEDGETVVGTITIGIDALENADNTTGNTSEITFAQKADESASTSREGVEITATFTPNSVNMTTEYAVKNIDWSGLLGLEDPTGNGLDVKVEAKNGGVYEVTIGDKTYVGTMTMAKGSGDDTFELKVAGDDGSAWGVLKLTVDASINGNNQTISAAAKSVGTLKVEDVDTGSSADGVADEKTDYNKGLKANPEDFDITMQIGDTSDEYNQMTLTIQSMTTDSLGISGLSIANVPSANSAIGYIKDAINNVSSIRGKLGAYQNRLEHTANNLSVMTENIQDAESTIRDTDVAEEMMAYTKNNILVQSAQAMLAQANAVPQGVLQLLQ